MSGQHKDDEQSVRYCEKCLAEGKHTLVEGPALVGPTEVDSLVPNEKRALQDIGGRFCGAHAIGFMWGVIGRLAKEAYVVALRMEAPPVDRFVALKEVGIAACLGDPTPERERERLTNFVENELSELLQERLKPRDDEQALLANAQDDLSTVAYSRLMILRSPEDIHKRAEGAAILGAFMNLNHVMEKFGEASRDTTKQHHDYEHALYELQKQFAAGNYDYVIMMSHIEISSLLKRACRELELGDIERGASEWKQLLEKLRSGRVVLSYESDLRQFNHVRNIIEHREDFGQDEVSKYRNDNKFWAGRGLDLTTQLYLDTGREIARQDSKVAVDLRLGSTSGEEREEETSTAPEAKTVSSSEFEEMKEVHHKNVKPKIAFEWKIWDLVPAMYKYYCYAYFVDRTSIRLSGTRITGIKVSGSPVQGMFGTSFDLTNTKKKGGIRLRFWYERPTVVRLMIVLAQNDNPIQKQTRWVVNKNLSKQETGLYKQAISQTAEIHGFPTDGATVTEEFVVEDEKAGIIRPAQAGRH